MISFRNSVCVGSASLGLHPHPLIHPSGDRLALQSESRIAQSATRIAQESGVAQHETERAGVGREGSETERIGERRFLVVKARKRRITSDPSRRLCDPDLQLAL